MKIDTWKWNYFFDYHSSLFKHFSRSSEFAKPAQKVYAGSFYQDSRSVYTYKVFIQQVWEINISLKISFHPKCKARQKFSFVLFLLKQEYIGMKLFVDIQGFQFSLLSLPKSKDNTSLSLLFVY